MAAVKPIFPDLLHGFLIIAVVRFPICFAKGKVPVNQLVTLSLKMKIGGLLIIIAPFADSPITTSMGAYMNLQRIEPILAYVALEITHVVLDKIAEKLVDRTLFGVEICFIDSFCERVMALIHRASRVFASPPVDRAIMFNALSKFGKLSPAFVVQPTPTHNDSNAVDSVTCSTATKASIACVHMDRY